MEEQLLIIFNIVNLLLVLAAMVFLTGALAEYRGSSIAAVLSYYLTGTFLFCCIRLLFLVVDLRYLSLHDSTVMLVWHGLFYLGIASYSVATYRTRQLFGLTGPKQTTVAVLLTSGMFLVLGGAIVTLGSIFDASLASYEDSIANKIGIQHLFAFLLAAYLTIHLFKVKKAFMGLVLTITYTLITATVFFSLVHLWELLNESWHVILLPDRVVELVEQIIWIPALAVLAYGYWAFSRAARRKELVGERPTPPHSPGSA